MLIKKSHKVSCQTPAELDLFCYCQCWLGLDMDGKSGVGFQNVYTYIKGQTASYLGLFGGVDTSESHMEASPKLLYQTGIQCQNNHWGDPSEICITYCTHIYMHRNMTLAVLSTSLLEYVQDAMQSCCWSWCSRHKGRQSQHSCCWNRWLSKRPEVGQRPQLDTPPNKLCTASTASVIHSSCDTAAMYWGGFLRNGTVELELLKISLESALMKTLRPTWTWIWMKSEDCQRFAHLALSQEQFYVSSKDRTAGILADSLPFREYEETMADSTV